jgi:iron complex outermembrane receptor protein
VKLGAEYELTHAGGAATLLRVDYNWQDDVFFTEFNNADAMQEAHGKLDMSATYTSAEGQWSVSLWGNNLTDEDIIVNNIITAALYGNVRVGSTGAPRTFGASLSYNF